MKITLKMSDESGRSVKTEIPVYAEHLEDDIDYFVYAYDKSRLHLLKMVKEIEDPKPFEKDPTVYAAVPRDKHISTLNEIKNLIITIAEAEGQIVMVDGQVKLETSQYIEAIKNNLEKLLEDYYPQD